MMLSLGLTCYIKSNIIDILKKIEVNLIWIGGKTTLETNMNPQ